MPVTGNNTPDTISVQVSLDGFCFRTTGEESFSSPWLGTEKVFTTKEFRRQYDVVEIALMTPKVALAPEIFFEASEARKALSEVCAIRDTDKVGTVEVPAYGAVLVYSNSIDESLSRVISQTVFLKDGTSVSVLPEMYYLLRDVQGLEGHNKIAASYRDGHLYLAIAQGDVLKLCNVYEAVDFTTAEYFIFLALKELQLNPEVSSIAFRTPLGEEERLSLYRYFKSVEQL